MQVALLRGDNFRLYRSLEIRPHARLNLVTGTNAAGKTSLLEALFVSTRGRSFRAQNLSELCGAAKADWNAFVELNGTQGNHRIGIGWSRSGTEMRLDEVRNARVSDVVRTAPIQLIDPLAHRLLDDGPAYRRSFVDWGVFHVEHRFLDIWRRYQRALKQRNSALREGLDDRAVQSWNEELAGTGGQLSDMRRGHVQAATRRISVWTERFLGTSQVLCEWQQGWPESETYQDLLDRNLEQHRRMGTTVQGPHRAELRITLADTKAKGRVSRGQQKMLIAAMVLAQAELMASAGVPMPILLLDDFASELAPDFQHRLAEGLAEYPGQKFITAFEVPAGFSRAEAGLFHVEHGTIRPLNALH